MDSEELKETDEVNLNSSIMTEEEREEILQELCKVCIKLSKHGRSGDGCGVSFSFCVCPVGRGDQHTEAGLVL